jgi:hypothetical protein
MDVLTELGLSAESDIGALMRDQPERPLLEREYEAELAEERRERRGGAGRSRDDDEGDRWARSAAVRKRQLGEWAAALREFDRSWSEIAEATNESVDDVRDAFRLVESTTE